MKNIYSSRIFHRYTTYHSYKYISYKIINFMETPTSLLTFYSPIQRYISAVEKEFNQIPDERKEVLKELTAYIQLKVKTVHPVQLTFICTHNSRRSHISQI